MLALLIIQVLSLAVSLAAADPTVNPREIAATSRSTITDLTQALITPTLTVPSLTSYGTPISLSSPVPTASAQSNSSNFAFSLLEKAVDNSAIPEHINVTCLNCTTTGTIEFVSGGYNDDDDLVIQAAEFFEDGYLELLTQNVGANYTFNLFLFSAPSEAGFQVPLTPLPIPLFVLPIADFAIATLSLQVLLALSMQASVMANMYPALTISVPDNSRIYLNISDPESSYISGFNDTKITPTLNVDVSEAEMNMIVGLDYVITAEIVSGVPDLVDVSGDVGLSLGIPLMNITATSVQKVNATCDPPSGSEQIYDEAVAVDFAAIFAANVTGGVAADLLGWHPSWEAPVAGFSLNFPVDRSCLKFEPAAHGLVDVTASVSASTAVSTGRKSKNAAAPHQPVSSLGGLGAFVIFMLELLVM